MKFTSEEKLLDCIRTGVDLYSPSLELYMFLYNDAGAVCTYSIAHDGFHAQTSDRRSRSGSGNR